MYRIEIAIINKLGLHARAATKFVQLCSRYGCEITVSNGDKSVNGKSIMALMTLAAKQGTILYLDAKGEEEIELLESLSQLIADRFGESV